MPTSPLRMSTRLPRTKVNSTPKGKKFEVVNTAEAAAEIAHLNNLLATKYSQEKKTLESTGRNRLGWKSRSRNSTIQPAQASAIKAQAVALKSIHDKKVAMANSKKTKHAELMDKIRN